MKGAHKDIYRGVFSHETLEVQKLHMLHSHVVQTPTFDLRLK